jgi:hypothetical protein
MKTPLATKVNLALKMSMFHVFCPKGMQAFIAPYKVVFTSEIQRRFLLDWYRFGGILMRLIFVLLFASFGLFSCAPSSGSSSSGQVSPEPSVDQASYNSVIDVTWCQPTVAQQSFYFAWIFHKNGVADYIRRDVQTNKALLTIEKSWHMENKVLIVTRAETGAEDFRRLVSFDLDLNSGVKHMLWWLTDGSDTEPINLTECK